jgi:YegS/Rv2252/BmrU family lipid kinase
MPRLKMILNPAADHGHASELGLTLRELLDRQAQAASHDGCRYELTWVKTEYPRHAVDLAAQAKEEGYDVVVAIGGDGTVHEVINGLMQIDPDQRPQLGVIPAGSGNDFAANLGLPPQPFEAARALFGPSDRLVDVGLITGPDGQLEYWDNTIGVGFSGAVNIATRHLRRWRGFMLYFIATLETILFRPPALNTRLTIDDKPPFERPISMLSLCNGPREGGGFPVMPGALMDDGLISYAIMRKMGRVNMLRFVPVVMKGKHFSYPRFFEGGTAQRFEIESDRAMAIHTDGEIYSSWETDVRHIVVSMIPAAIRVLNGA